MKTDTTDCAETILWEQIATTFRFLGDILSNVLTEQSLMQIRAVLSDTPGEDTGYGKMRQFMFEKTSCAPEDLLQELVIDWTLLFGGVNQKSGPKPPYAGVWLSPDGVGIEVMCAIGQFYVNSNLRACSEGSNRLDYLGVELEYVGCLARRIAYGQIEEIAVLEQFMDQFMGSWIEAYVLDAHEKGQTDFWKGFLDLMLGSLQDVRALVRTYNS